MADRLSERDSLEQAEEDYLDVLDGLISQYEKEHHAVAPLPDGEFLRELIDARGVNQRQVAEATGIVYSMISAVLAGRRNSDARPDRHSARYFHVQVGAFLFAPTNG